MTQDQWTTVADVASAVCLLGGAFLAFAAGVGVLRFPDLVAVFQMLTAPVAAHMVGRAGYRTGKVRSDLLVVDELTSDQERAQVRDHGRAEDDGPRD